MKIVFISGQLTTGWDGKNREFIKNRVIAAEKYQIALVNAGVGCFCAHTHTSFHHEKGGVAPESFYYELDMTFLKRIADAVLAMPDWENSVGAKKEIEWAIENDLLIFYPKSPQDINDIIIWNKKEA